ncbi:MAG TPA: type IX secretion system protein PorQ, partial [Segetibacter sp.]
MKIWCLFTLIFSIVKTNAQTLGGNAIFNFVKQPNTAQLSSLGGVNISIISNDVGMAFHNPALLRSEMHGHVNTSFNAFVAGVKNYSLTTAYHSAKYNTNFSFGLNYFNYGNIVQTDASGNELGTFKPNDYVVQFAGSRQYKEKWFYGATIKFINSQYAQYKSNGLALDVGVTYSDTINHLQASVVVKNMGSQLKTYDGSNRKEELPFDLQAGLTKRLAKAPLQFSITAHNLHRFNIYNNDTAFLAEEGDEGFRDKKFTIAKIVSHLVLSTQAYIGD